MANGVTAFASRSFSGLERMGGQMLFYGRVLKAVPFTIKNYSKEISRLHFLRQQVEVDAWGGSTNEIWNLAIQAGPVASIVGVEVDANG